MKKVDPSVLRTWNEHPGVSVDLIVHVKGDVRQQSTVLAERGAQIKRQFHLTSTLAVRCTARVALALVAEPWVTQIELDRPVRALGAKSHGR